MNEPDKVLVLTPYRYDIAPGQRFRWEQWARFAQGDQVFVKQICFESDRLAEARKARRFFPILFYYLTGYFVYLARIISSLGSFDAVVVYRNAVLGGPPIVETLLFLLKRKVVYDFDDAIFLVPPVGDTFLRRVLRCDWRVAYICRRACLVIVGNEFLAAFARQHNQAVVIYPSTVDVELSRPLEQPQNSKPVPVVGWIGSPTTLPYLETILPEIAALQKEYEFDLLVVGGEIDLDAVGVRGQCKPWSSKREVELLNEMDIGLMPLRDSPWERGKCSFKAIQYQSVGIPAVVSDVGMNRIAVLDQKTGFVIPAGGDWHEPIVKLLTDSSYRNRLGENARRHIEEHFSGQTTAPRVFADIRNHCL